MNDDHHDTDAPDAHAAGDDARGPSAPSGRDPMPAKPGPAQDHIEELIDEGLEESFPASDPLAVPVPPDTPRGATGRRSL